MAGADDVKTDSKFDVNVVYNGVTKPITVVVNQPIQAALQHAINAFAPIAQPHLLALYTEAGTELLNDQKVGEAGIKPGDTLLLRPSQVRGGR